MNDRRPDPVMVIGATGTHGGAVARELLAAGYAVRALVRNPGSGRALSLRETGAVLVTGDLDDRGSLVRAFHDVAVVYAVTTPFAGGAGEEERQGDNIIAAAGQADLPWLLLASVAAADRAPVPHFASKARIERGLRASAVPWTVIAPSYFFENVDGVAGAGDIRPGPDRPDPGAESRSGGHVRVPQRRRVRH
jgi:uncharacterized protein YbjT (DUF2867 family)